MDLDSLELVYCYMCLDPCQPNLYMLRQKLKYDELLGVNVGDTIHMEVTGISGSITVKVTEITAALTPQGVYFSRQAWENCDESFIPTLKDPGNMRL